MNPDVSDQKPSTTSWNEGERHSTRNFAHKIPPCQNAHKFICKHTPRLHASSNFQRNRFRGAAREATSAVFRTDFPGRSRYPTMKRSNVPVSLQPETVHTIRTISRLTRPRAGTVLVKTIILMAQNVSGELLQLKERITWERRLKDLQFDGTIYPAFCTDNNRPGTDWIAKLHLPKESSSIDSCPKCSCRYKSFVRPTLLSLPERKPPWSRMQVHPGGSHPRDLQPTYFFSRMERCYSGASSGKISARFISFSASVWKLPPHDRQRYKRHQPEPRHSLPFTDEARLDHLPKKPIPTTGLWGSTAPHIRDKRFKHGELLKSMPSTFDKLQELYHFEDNLWFHSLDLPLKIPGMLPFVQQLTRTNVAKWEPEEVDCPLMQKYLLQSLSEGLSLLNRLPLNRIDERPTAVEARAKHRSRLIAACLESAYQAWTRAYPCSSPSDHVHQVDERATVETFFKRLVSPGLFVKHDDVIEDVFDEVNDTVVDPEENTVRYRIRTELAWQLRVSRPLQQFICWEHPTCLECEVPVCNYRPEAFDLKPLECYRFSCLPYTQAPDFSEYARSVAGYWSHTPFWRGDPCEFGLVGALDVVRGEQVHKNLARSALPEDVKSEVIMQHGLSEGLLSAFAWTSAQAYNQGFTLYNEITYPFAAQLVLFDADHIQLLRYQLNSLCSLWKSEDSGLPYNMAWYSPKVRLFDFDSSAHHPISINPHAISLLVTAMQHPIDTTRSSTQLRPYLPTSDYDVDKAYFIPSAGDTQYTPIHPSASNAESAELLLSEQELAALDETQQKAVSLPTRLFNPPRPNPNDVFYFKPTDRSKLNAEFKEEMPSFGGEFGELPGRFNILAQKYRIEKRNRGARSHVQAPPRRWR
ncbi:unnamed protein product [Dicrocoelium dendriticum]|nr:unnamed protein product [Dicrocoelium dendriticum]